MLIRCFFLPRCFLILSVLLLSGSAIAGIPDCVDYAEGLRPLQPTSMAHEVTCLETAPGLLVAGGGDTVSVLERLAGDELQFLGSVALEGPVGDLTVQGSLVVLAMGAAGVTVVDISSPISPVITGTLAFDTPVVSVAAAETADTIVAVTQDGLVLVLNVSVASSPAVVGDVATGQAIRHSVCGPGYAYACGDGALVTVDISDIFNPVVTDVIDDSAPIFEQFVADFRQLAVADGRLLAAGTYWFEWSDEWSWYYAEGPALEVFNLDDPAHPVFEAWSMAETDAVGLAPGSAFTVKDDKLSVFSPEDLTPRGALPVEGPLVDIAATGETIYLAAGLMGIQTVDATNPQTMVPAATFGVEGNHRGGDSRYTFTWTDISNGNWASFVYRIYSLADPMDPVVVRQGSVGGMNTYPGAQLFDVQDDFVCFGATSYAEGPIGSSLYDFSVDPYLSVPLPGTAEIIMLAGDIAWMYGYEGLRAISFSNFNAPVEVGSLDITSGNVQRVGDELVIFNGNPAGVQVLDLSDPSDPRAGPVVSLPSYVRKAAWHQGNLVLAMDNQELAVVDPAVPEILSTFPLPGDYSHIASTDDVVLILWENEMWVLSLDDATNPAWLAEAVLLPCNSQGAVAQDNLVYIASYYSGPMAFDFTDPAQPVFLGVAAGYNGTIHLGDGYMRVGGGVYPLHCSSNVGVVDGDDHDNGEIPPAAFALEAAVPNPFNPTTELRFNLESAGQVDLDVYDLKGRQVQSLVSREMLPGRHVSVWNGRDNAGRAVPSGVYFARLRADGGVASRKLVLIR